MVENQEIMCEDCGNIMEERGVIIDSVEYAELMGIDLNTNGSYNEGSICTQEALKGRSKFSRKLYQCPRCKSVKIQDRR